MPCACINGLDLYYETLGHGPPLVCVHGAGGNHLSWYQQAPHFARRFLVVTYDQRNWGWSPEHAPGQGGRAFVPDLCGLLDHLGLAAAHFVGRAMGGCTAAGLASSYPERVLSLTLSGTHGGIESHEIRAAIRLRPERPQTAALPFPVSPSLSGRFALAHPERAFLFNGIAALNPPRPGESMPEHLRSIARLTVEQAAALRPPRLFVAGEDAVVVPPAAIAPAHRLVPRSRLAIVPATGHSVYFEEPAIFNRLVDDFIDRVSG